jgi:diguanylate cyclase (GGDEF)-like protein
MESSTTRASAPLAVDPSLLGAAAAKAAEAAGDASDPLAAIDAATGAFHHSLAGILPSVFVLEHGRLWLVSQRGYAVVPDGIRVQSGIMGRAVRLGRPQLATDVRADVDYVPALPGVCSELAVPLRVGGSVVGVLNVESERVLPEEAHRLLRPLELALSPLAAALRESRRLDLGALARLFVYFSSLRDADEIAALATASIPKVLPVEASQVVMWDDAGSPVVVATWQSDDAGVEPLGIDEIDRSRTLVDSSVVCQLLGAARATDGHDPSVVWLPLRANGEEIGALIGIGSGTIEADPAQLDTAALLAAHVAASLDAAAALDRERQSAVTDPLTGILNRRGLEAHLERALAASQKSRAPLSLLVFDCDDFKEINDRAGHAFGDSLLAEIARVLGSSLSAGVKAARLGGDEFVVVLPDAGMEVALKVGSELQAVLREGLTDAGFPLRISGGIATYPFDGASGSMLIRAADQALYAAKARGKDRISSFAELVRREQARITVEPFAEAGGERRGGAGRGDGSVLAEATEAAAALELEQSADRVCNRLCKSLVFVIGATGCMASRVIGDFVVDASGHALREVSLGEGATYRLSDFPLTSQVLESGEPVAISFLDGDVDPAEAFVLRELDMNALLMLPLYVRGEPWALIELYDMRLRRFSEDDVAVARFLVEQAGRRIEAIGPDEAPVSESPVYELPPDAGSWRPRTR